MSSKQSIGRYLLFFLQGILIGTGAILPGISGGVLCVAFGIYEPMMAFFVHPIRSLRENYGLFIPVILGAGVGFVLLAKVVEAFLAVASVAALSLFSGLICGTVPALMKKTAQRDPGHSWSVFLITLMAAFAFFRLLDTGMKGGLEPNVGWYLFCGVVWGLSMVVPGLSSSSILLFMGLYQPMAQGIGDLAPGVLLPLAAGFVVTIVLTSRLVNYLLQRHYALFSQMILGFVLASVLMILPTRFSGAGELLLGVACFAGGFSVARWMDIVQDKREENKPA